MYNTKQIAERIRECAKQKKIKIGVMLSELGLGVNAISQLAAGKGMAYLDLARIADYLGESVDFLLGRTERSDIQRASLGDLTDEEYHSVTVYSEFLQWKRIKESEKESKNQKSE